MPERTTARFLPLPHVAVSGRLHRDSRARLFGAAGAATLAPYLRCVVVDGVLESAG